MPDTKPEPVFTVDVAVEGGTAVVRCNGKLVTGTISVLQEEVRRLIPQYRRIVLQMANVSRMDSTGIGAVIGLYVSARRAHSSLELVSFSDAIRKMLTASRLLELLEACGQASIPIT